MKSKKSDGSIFDKIKHMYLKFMYTPESVEKIEKQPKVSFKDRLKDNWYNWIVLPIIAIAMITAFVVVHNIQENERLERLRGEYYHSELRGDKAQIQTRDLDNLFINTGDRKPVKMAYSKLGDKVAYSLSYNLNDNVEGEWTANRYFTSGQIVALLLKGYPNVDYKTMGFDSEEDAYAATQLAVFELVNAKDYSMKNGEFSLDNLVAINKRDDQRCKKIITKAKEIYNYAINNPYEINTDVKSDGLEKPLEEVDGGVLVGPLTFTTYTDEETKRLLSQDYNDDISVGVASFMQNTNAIFLDKDLNEIKSISSGDTFYIKVLSEDKVFSVVDISAHTNYLIGRIHSKDGTDKKFVTLDKKGFAYVENFSIIYGLDFGYTNVSFVMGNKKLLDGVRFYIYDEEGTLIEDADGYATDYEFALPVGKYNLEIYYEPKGYFFKDKAVYFEVKKGEHTTLEITVESINDNK